MPDAPDPVTSPPAQPFQPWDPSSAYPGDDGQSTPEHVYDAKGGPGSADPWPKIQEGGAADASGKVSGGWPGNGTSSAGPWKST
jgi:hypothetical protein